MPDANRRAPGFDIKYIYAQTQANTAARNVEERLLDARNLRLAMAGHLSGWLFYAAADLTGPGAANNTLTGLRRQANYQARQQPETDRLNSILSLDKPHTPACLSLARCHLVTAR